MSILYLISTPIGNLEDLTYRAVKVLGSVQALACEDTRHTRIVLDRYGIAAPPILLSYHEHNEEQAGQRILELLESGESVGLCTNAGTPGISDPGSSYRPNAFSYLYSLCLPSLRPMPAAPMLQE